MNEHHVERVNSALAHYKKTVSEETKICIIWLLTDLRHLCAKEGLDLRELLKLSFKYFWRESVNLSDGDRDAP